MFHRRKMYEKPALPPAALLRHLMDRGLIVPNKDTAETTLRAIGYYRLLVYMRPLQQVSLTSGRRMFLPGTTFGDVLALL